MVCGRRPAHRANAKPSDDFTGQIKRRAPRGRAVLAFTGPVSYAKPASARNTTHTPQQDGPVAENSPVLNPPSQDILNRLTSIVGPANALSNPTEQTAHLTEWRDRYIGKTPLVLKPATTGEVAAIMAMAHEHRIAIVPQGGNTGLVGGQIPFETDTEIVLSLSRLNKIRHVDTACGALVCEAGVTLAAAQTAADSIDRLFPLSLGSEGTCQIGGNLATNAGGTAVLAYGTMRDLTYGLEVVLSDGRVLSDLGALKKDNTGYDLKHLFIGSEGTLGIITAATLKTVPKPTRFETAFLAFKDLEDILDFYRLATSRLSSSLTTFEFMPRRAMEFLAAHIEGARPPLGLEAPWYGLIEVSHFTDAGPENANSALLKTLEHALEANLIIDATVAEAERQRADFWRLREAISEVQKNEGGSIKHDVSVPVETIPAFIATANALIETLCPGARPVPFGHFGDGNVHYNISQPIDIDREAFLARWDDINREVHALVARMGGSISAEHGIGRMKRDELTAYKDPVALATMRSIKAALDPQGILNPGKVL